MPKCNHKQTSKSVASKASKILSDDRYSNTSKSVAGSALSQTKKVNSLYRLSVVLAAPRSFFFKKPSNIFLREKSVSNRYCFI